jgi:peptidoglycan hydrolase-like protein with peptidoglycan-binding domain
MEDKTMKKLFILIALMFTLAVISNAQIATLYPDPATGTIIDYKTNNTLTNTTAKYFYFYFTPDQYNAQSVVINLDSASGNHTNVAIVLSGRMCDEQAWTAIGSTINWKGTTSDTTILITNATEVAYRQFKILFTGTGTGTTTIDRQVFKIWYGIP